MNNVVDELVNIYNRRDKKHFLVSKKPIYHYTSPEGFAGIVEKQAIWATDLLYLNDMYEGIYVTSLMIDNLDYLCDNHAILAKKVKMAIDKLNNSIIGDTSFYKTYTISFSLDKDSLNMWNYYTKGNSIQGYNIEYDVNILEKSLCIDVYNALENPLSNPDDRLKFDHGKVIYDRKKQVLIIKEIFDDFLKIDPECLDNDDLTYMAYLIVRKVFYIGLFFKEEAFKQEKEYRFVCSLSLVDDESLQNKGIPWRENFRSVNGIIIPYQVCLFDEKAVTGVCFSPTLDGRLTEISIKRIMSGKYTNVNRIEQSKIPVRY